MTEKQITAIRDAADFIKALKAAAGTYQCEAGTRVVGTVARGFVETHRTEQLLGVLDEILGPCPDKGGE